MMTMSIDSSGEYKGTIAPIVAATVWRGCASVMGARRRASMRTTRLAGRPTQGLLTWSF